MNIDYIHDFNPKTEDELGALQNKLSSRIDLTTKFQVNKISYVAGVDLSYFEIKGEQYGTCCITVIDYKTKKFLKTVNSFGKVTFPYIAGYLAFRELPLFLDAVKKLSYEPDIFMFDGNGYLHYNHMGIATHASFFIQKPTIGVAKSYLKIKGTNYIMPEDNLFSYTNITIDNEIYGRVLRTRKGNKPIFVSCGNYIDLDTATNIVTSLIGKESKIPIPTRLADLETHQYRDYLKKALQKIN